MKKRLFVVLAVLALTVCLLPMVVGAEEADHVCALGEPSGRQVVKEATCLENGYEKDAYYCSCGRFLKLGSVSYIIPAKGHESVVTTPALAPTCTKDGNTEGKNCSRCGVVTVVSESISRMGHIPVVGEPVYTAPTCQKIGTTVTETKCDRCGDVISTKTVRHAKVPCDTKVEIPAVEPGCLTAGNTAGAKCSMCGKTTIETKVIPQLNHDENFKIVRTDVKAASCSETGSYREGKECRRCGKVVSKSVEVFTIAKLPHTEVKVDAVAATCQKSGLTEGKVCSVCNTVTVEQKEVKPLEHKWDEGVVINNVTTYTCTVCGTTYEEETPVLKLTVDPNLDSVPKTGNAFIEWLYALIAG